MLEEELLLQFKKKREREKKKEKGQTSRNYKGKKI